MYIVFEKVVGNVGNLGSNDTWIGWSEEMQDALLDTPPVVCQSGCCISALNVQHTTPSIIHTIVRDSTYTLIRDCTGCIQDLFLANCFQLLQAQLESIQLSRYICSQLCNLWFSNILIESHNKTQLLWRFLLPRYHCTPVVCKTRGTIGVLEVAPPLSLIEPHEDVL